MIDKLKACLPTDILTRTKHFLVWAWEWVSWGAKGLWRSCGSVWRNPMTYPAVALAGVLGWYGGHLWGARHQETLNNNLIKTIGALETARKQVSQARARISALEESLTHLSARSAEPSLPVAAPAAPVRARVKPVAKPTVEATPASKPFSWTN